jgi:hypothetical protein
VCSRVRRSISTWRASLTTDDSNVTKVPAGTTEGEALDQAPRGFLALVTTAAFLTFVQAFMVAPILPQLA